MTDNRPLVYISNDDGVDAPGIHRLVDCLADYCRIIVIAPDSPRSAQSSAITVSRNLHSTPLPDYNGAKFFSVDGTPVDCLKLAVHLFGKPDFIFAGINHGPNDGNSVIYSGTMGIVIEGCMLSVPSVGFSHLSHDWATDLNPYMTHVGHIAKEVIAKGLPDGVCLNVNMPVGGKIEGSRICRAAKGHWVEEFDNICVNDATEFKLTGRFVEIESPDATDTDRYWLRNNYISIVPVSPDMTAYGHISVLSQRLNL